MNKEVVTNLFAENKSMIAVADTLDFKPKLAKVTPPRSDKDSLQVQNPLEICCCAGIFVDSPSR